MKHLLFIFAVLLFASCENFSNGTRVGYLTKLSKSGNIFKSWEGHLNSTQTGMNSSDPFDFSVDNDNEPQGLVAALDSAVELGWKVRLTYHQTKGKNWFNNRGATNYFVTNAEVLDRHTPQVPK